MIFKFNTKQILFLVLDNLRKNTTVTKNKSVLCKHGHMFLCQVFGIVYDFTGPSIAGVSESQADKPNKHVNMF